LYSGECEIRDAIIAKSGDKKAKTLVVDEHGGGNGVAFGGGNSFSYEDVILARK